VAGGFYRGATAAAVAGSSWLAPGDLEAHRNDWVEPLAFGYRGHQLLEMPPNGQGSIAGWALESLRSPGLPDQVEALAAAYERGYATIGGDMEGARVSLQRAIAVLDVQEQRLPAARDVRDPPGRRAGCGLREAMRRHRMSFTSSVAGLCK
jgi:gamma-glutamyltranspeptidase